MNVEIHHPSFWSMIDPAVELERLASGFQFVEGPIWHPDQRSLIFSDIVGNTMYRWSEREGIAVFRHPSHMANGNAYDRLGRIVTCEHATSRLTRASLEGHMEVLASHFAGQELNSPNDAVVKEDGSIYFTDPTSGRGPRYGVPRPQALDFQGVYRLDLASKVLTLLVDDFAKPNGLCFSRDDSRLFVNDSDRAHIRVFDVLEDGTLASGRVWAELGSLGAGVADGMKVDQADHLYCCGPGGIHIFAADATLLGVIQMPERTANLCFGDDNLRSLYITASTSIYRLRVLVSGHNLFRERPKVGAVSHA
jgi:gluconolactonase